MTLFTILAGICSILSLFITAWTLSKVMKIENQFIDKSRHTTTQRLSAKKVQNSNIKQVGRNSHD